MPGQIPRVAATARTGLARAFARRMLVLPILLLVLTTGLALTRAYGQESPETLAAQLQARDQGRLEYHQATGLVRFYSAGDEASAQALKAMEGGPSAQSEPGAVALSFLESYGSLFGVHAPSRDLTLQRQTVADRGRSFLRYQQLYQGVPVMAGELIVQVAAGMVLSANGEVAPIESLSVEPNLNAAEARDRALGMVAKGSGLAAEQLAATEPELWVYDPRLLTPYDLPARLVWRMEISGEEGLLHQMVLIDAHLGAVVLQLDLVESALNRAIYDSGNVRWDPLPGITLVRSEGQVESSVTDANLAYDYLGDAYAFYEGYHGRDSYDDQGAILKATVRYCTQNTQYACPYQNAFWNGYYQQFAFGDGMVADDVVAHEYTHAVTDHTSRLFYLYQSGALSEAMSDVWGEFVDLVNERPGEDPGDRWLMGEDLSIGAIRDMADPWRSYQPDRMTSSDWECDLSFYDQGGVHTNSGVLNKATFLITDGGYFNGQTVTGLGLEKAADIFYALQTNWLTSGSDYLDVSSLLPAACDSLVGNGEIAPFDCQQVRSAIAATEMASPPPAACRPVEAPLCPDGLPVTDLFFDDLEDPSLGNWVKQSLLGSYQGWFYPQNTHPYGYFDATYATSGAMNLWGDNTDIVMDAAIAMTEGVALPASAPVYFRFNHSYMFEVYPNPLVPSVFLYLDGGLVEYSTNDGDTWMDAGALFDSGGYNGSIYDYWANPLAGRPAFVNTSYGYMSSRLELTPLAGQSVRFRFRIGTDSEGGDYGWFLDDIRLYACGTVAATATPTPTGTPTPTPTPTPTASPTHTATPTVAPTPTPTPTPAFSYLPFLHR